MCEAKSHRYTCGHWAGLTSMSECELIEDSFEPDATDSSRSSPSHPSETTSQTSSHKSSSKDKTSSLSTNDSLLKQHAPSQQKCTHRGLKILWDPIPGVCKWCRSNGEDNSEREEFLEDLKVWGLGRKIASAVIEMRKGKLDEWYDRCHGKF